MTIRNDRWTEGVARIVIEAERIAAANGSSTIRPFDLLCALRREESRAAEILTAFDVPVDFTSSFRSDGDAKLNSQQITESDGSPDDLENHLPPNESLKRVLQQAELQAATAGRHVEIGSEHVLWGLTVVPSPAADLLAEHGVTTASVEDRIAQQLGVSTEPLDVDFHLQSSAPIESDHTDVYRILDASANRAREGLRVLEDFVRFTLDDAHLTRELKRIRHEMSHRLKRRSAATLLAARDTTGDVGTRISTPSEARRESLIDVVQASFKRVQEALRTLEECDKIVATCRPDSAVRASSDESSFETIRYALYTLEKAVLLTYESRQRLQGRDLYLLVTEATCHHGSGAAIRAALQAGVGIVQVREKNLSDRKLVEHGLRVRAWTRQANALFIMNDRPDLTVLTDADGVHVGQDELTVRQARRIVGPRRLVGVSTHSIEQARQAVLDGADYIGVGPVFSSQTKQFDELAGLEFVRQVADEITLPWFAIGGICEERISQLRLAGVRRIAVSHAICSAENPSQATAELLEQLRTPMQ